MTLGLAAEPKRCVCVTAPLSATSAFTPACLSRNRVFTRCTALGVATAAVPDTLAGLRRHPARVTQATKSIHSVLADAPPAANEPATGVAR